MCGAPNCNASTEKAKFYVRLGSFTRPYCFDLIEHLCLDFSLREYDSFGDFPYTPNLSLSRLKLIITLRILAFYGFSGLRLK